MVSIISPKQHFTPFNLIGKILDNMLAPYDNLILLSEFYSWPGRAKNTGIPKCM